GSGPSGRRRRGRPQRTPSPSPQGDPPMPQKLKSGKPSRPRRSGNGSRAPRANNIRDVMTPDPRVLEPDASITDAANLMRESDIGDIVVVEDNRLSGILT